MYDIKFTMTRGVFREGGGLSPPEQIPKHAPDIEQIVFNIFRQLTWDAK